MLGDRSLTPVIPIWFCNATHQDKEQSIDRQCLTGSSQIYICGVSKLKLYRVFLCCCSARESLGREDP